MERSSGRAEMQKGGKGKKKKKKSIHTKAQRFGLWPLTAASNTL